jgi:hypothetical protein
VNARSGVAHLRSGLQNAPRVKARWIIVVLAVIAATAFAMSVQGGRWWSIGEVDIGPFGATQCFGGDCRPAGLGWLGGTARFERTGMATWAGALISAFVLLVLAAGVASRRIPKLAAKTVLVATFTALAAGVGFVVQFPGLDGASLDRGLWLFVAGVACSVGAAIAVLRARPAT